MDSDDSDIIMYFPDSGISPPPLPIQDSNAEESDLQAEDAMNQTLDHFPVSQNLGLYQDADLEFVPLPEEEQSRKKVDMEKMTFICEICDVNLSSFDTLKSHCKGIKHLTVTFYQLRLFCLKYRLILLLHF